MQQSHGLFAIAKLLVTSLDDNTGFCGEQQMVDVAENILTLCRRQQPQHAAVDNMFTYGA